METQDELIGQEEKLCKQNIALKNFQKFTNTLKVLFPTGYCHIDREYPCRKGRCPTDSPHWSCNFILSLLSFIQEDDSKVEAVTGLCSVPSFSFNGQIFCGIHCGVGMHRQTMKCSHQNHWHIQTLKQLPLFHSENN